MKTSQISDFPQFHNPLRDLHNDLNLQSRHVATRYAALRDCKQARDDVGRKQAAAEEVHNTMRFKDALSANGGQGQGWVWTAWANISAAEQAHNMRRVEDFQDELWKPLRCSLW